MRVRSFGVGFAPDVTWIDDRGFLIVRENDPRQPGRIVVWTWKRDEIDNALELWQEHHAGTPGFPKVHAFDDLLWIAYHDSERGHLRNLTTGHHVVLDPCQNNDPITFGHQWVAWQGAAADGWPITRMDLRTGEVAAAGFGQGTGLSRVLADGSVVLIDADRFTLPGATRPAFSEDLIVGEDASPDGRGLIWQLGSQRGELWPEVSVFTPQCAVGPFVAICGWSLSDALLWVGRRDELPAAVPTEPEEPEEPQEPEEPVANVWMNGLSVAQQVDRDYPQLLEKARREGERFRGDFVDQLAHRLNRIDRQRDDHDGVDRWGRKARRQGDAGSLNDDALTYRLSDDPANKKLIDVVAGDDFHVQWDVRPVHEEPGNGFWHPPVNADLDGDDDPGTKWPNPCQAFVAGAGNLCERCGWAPADHASAPPAGDVTNAQLLAAIQRLEARFDRVFR